MDAPATDTDAAGTASTPERPEDPMREHKKLYFRSAINTLLFYGTVLLVCLALPYFVALGVGVFFLLFYKREIRAFLASPLKRTRLRATSPPGEDRYHLTTFGPGEFDRDHAEQGL